MFGHQGKILRVNLGTDEIKQEPNEDEFPPCFTGLMKLSNKLRRH
jgi:aldehyde:ferredoxin oxidoreductase